MIAHKKDRAWLTLTHDIRNLLMGVDMVLQATVNESTGLGPRSRRLLTDTKNNCEVMIDMLDDVMDAHRLEKQRASASEGRLDIARVVQTAIRLVAFLAEEKQITVQAHMPDNVPVLPLDQYRVLRVVINLLHNAIKFSPAGETIYIDSEILDGKTVLIRITDRGPGMSPDRLPPARGRSNETPLTTWGLYYCRTVLAVMGGDLWIETPRAKDRKGTTFSFTLPMVGEPTWVPTAVGA